MSRQNCTNRIPKHSVAKSVVLFLTCLFNIVVRLTLFKTTKEKAKTMQEELQSLQKQDPKAAAETAAAREAEAEELRQKRDQLREKQAGEVHPNL